MISSLVTLRSHYYLFFRLSAMKEEKKNTNDLSLHLSECIDKNIKKQSQFPLEISALADVCSLEWREKCSQNWLCLKCKYQNKCKRNKKTKTKTIIKTWYMRVRTIVWSVGHTHTKMHQGNRIDEAKRECASNAIAYLVFVYGNKLPIVYACLC